MKPQEGLSDLDKMRVYGLIEFNTTVALTDASGNLIVFDKKSLAVFELFDNRGLDSLSSEVVIENSQATCLKGLFHFVNSKVVSRLNSTLVFKVNVDYGVDIFFKSTSAENPDLDK